jgi:hypothetical protein
LPDLSVDLGSVHRDEQLPLRTGDYRNHPKNARIIIAINSLKQLALDGDNALNDIKSPLKVYRSIPYGMAW